MPDLYILKRFLEPPVCDQIVAEMRSVEGTAATVYGRTTSGSIDQNIRRAIRVTPSDETVNLITQRLWARKEEIEKHFSVALSECEEPQFLRYREGDFFVAHQDGNTRLLRLESERRRISTVLFLSRETEQPEPNAYCGGALVFADLHQKFHLLAEPGMFVAFRSETTHEVTPVTHGERYSIASWYW